MRSRAESRAGFESWRILAKNYPATNGQVEYYESTGNAVQKICASSCRALCSLSKAAANKSANQNELFLHP